MDNVLAVGVGLGLRAIIDTITDRNDRVNSSLIGLWEGAVLRHFLSKYPRSVDPYVALAFRLLADLFYTESFMRMGIVLLWTFMGIFLSDVSVDVFADKRFRRITRRARRLFSLPSISTSSTPSRVHIMHIPASGSSAARSSQLPPTPGPGRRLAPRIPGNFSETETVTTFSDGAPVAPPQPSRSSSFISRTPSQVSRTPSQMSRTISHSSNTPSQPSRSNSIASSRSAEPIRIPAPAPRSPSELDYISLPVIPDNIEQTNPVTTAPLVAPIPVVAPVIPEAAVRPSAARMPVVPVVPAVSRASAIPTHARNGSIGSILSRTRSPSVSAIPVRTRASSISRTGTPAAGTTTPPVAPVPARTTTPAAAVVPPPKSNVSAAPPQSNVSAAPPKSTVSAAPPKSTVSAPPKSKIPSAIGTPARTSTPSATVVSTASRAPSVPPPRTPTPAAVLSDPESIRSGLTTPTSDTERQLYSPDGYRSGLTTPADRPTTPQDLPPVRVFDDATEGRQTPARSDSAPIPIRIYQRESASESAQMLAHPELIPEIITPATPGLNPPTEYMAPRSKTSGTPRPLSQSTAPPPYENTPGEDEKNSDEGSDQRDSVISNANDRTKIIARAESLRMLADESDKSRARLRQEYEEAKRTRDWWTAFRLKHEMELAMKQRNELNEKAAKRFWKAHNIRPEAQSIDVHRLKVPEALAKVEEALYTAIVSRSPELRIVTGRGKHSEGGIARLKLAITGLMQDYHIEVASDPSNPGVLVIVPPADAAGPSGATRA